MGRGILLGIRLFQRTTRRVALTEAGRAYVERCRAVLGLVQEAEAELHAKQTEPRGKLTRTRCPTQLLRQRSADPADLHAQVLEPSRHPQRPAGRAH